MVHIINLQLTLSLNYIDDWHVISNENSKTYLHYISVWSTWYKSQNEKCCQKKRVKSAESTNDERLLLWNWQQQPSLIEFHNQLKPKTYIQEDNKNQIRLFIFVFIKVCYKKMLLKNVYYDIGAVFWIVTIEILIRENEAACRPARATV